MCTCSKEVPCLILDRRKACLPLAWCAWRQRFHFDAFLVVQTFPILSRKIFYNFRFSRLLWKWWRKGPGRLLYALNFSHSFQKGFLISWQFSVFQVIVKMIEKRPWAYALRSKLFLYIFNKNGSIYRLFPVIQFTKKMILLNFDLSEIFYYKSSTLFFTKYWKKHRRLRQFNDTSRDYFFTLNGILSLPWDTWKNIPPEREVLNI